MYTVLNVAIICSNNPLLLLLFESRPLFKYQLVFENFWYAEFLTSKSPRSVVWKYCRASLKEMSGVGFESSVRAGDITQEVIFAEQNLQTKNLTKPS